MTSCLVWSRGYTITGIITDSNENPLIGVTIVADTWRGHRSIQWHQDTDALGRFFWGDAPKDEVQFDIFEQGFMSRRNHPMSSSSEDDRIVLHPPLNITGCVVDAVTGESIQSYTIMCGFADHSFWNKRDATEFDSSSYVLTISEPRDKGYALCVEADGYEPGVSRTVHVDEGQVVIDFALKPFGSTQRLQGIVCLANGHPATEADVALVAASRRVSIYDGQLTQKESLEHYVQTQSDGRFSFIQPEGDYQIVALHDQGYALVDANVFSTTETLILEPWSRIEGTLFIGSQPSKNQEISVHHTLVFPVSQGPYVFWNNRATTDTPWPFCGQ